MESSLVWLAGLMCQAQLTSGSPNTEPSQQALSRVYRDKCSDVIEILIRHIIGTDFLNTWMSKKWSSTDHLSRPQYRTLQASCSKRGPASCDNSRNTDPHRLHRWIARTCRSLRGTAAFIKYWTRRLAMQNWRHPKHQPGHR